MRILIAEDEMVSRRFICKFLQNYGICDVAYDGSEAIDAFVLSLEDNTPYDLICLDIMMPNVDGIEALKKIREIEKEKKIPEEKRVKIIMTTALDDVKNVQETFEHGCQGYAVKPLDTEKMIEVMQKLELNIANK